MIEERIYKAVMNILKIRIDENKIITVASARTGYNFVPHPFSDEIKDKELKGKSLKQIGNILDKELGKIGFKFIKRINIK